MQLHELRRVVAFAPRLAVVRWLPLVGVFGLSACTGAPPREAAAATPAQYSRRADAVRDTWAADIDSLRLATDRLQQAISALPDTASIDATAAAQRAFIDARLAFKRIEFLAAYYEPSTTDAINGPALPEVEDEEGPETVIAPEGFQVIEELLFPAPTPTDRPQLINETRNLAAYITRLHTAAARQRITDDRIWDAAKLEVARIVSLGVTGFDSPVALQSLPEAAASIRGMRTAFARYRDTLAAPAWSTLDASFDRAITMLDTARSFDAFDRLHFITTAANPLAYALADARRSLGIGTPEERRAYRVSAATLFDSGAFDTHAFAAPHTERATPAQVALGRRLFFDPQLSGGGDVACASCHDPEKAFTDGRVRSPSRTGRVALRNSPTMINAGLQVGSFSDLRTTYLEDQVTDVVGNAEEMHGSIETVARQLGTDSSYQRAFAAAYPGSARSSVSGPQVRSAIASYVRSLVALNSRADRAFRGDTAALTSEERLGLNLFMGKAKCGTCHFAPLFNGTVPPMYQESEVEVLGVPSRSIVRGATVDPDSGRFRVTRSAPHLHAFKTPSVRNTGLTAPYMHNGVYRTLDEVVDFYNRGGGAGIGIALPNQTLPPDSLGLTRAEQRAIVRFMQALTDTAAVTESAEARAYKASLRGRIATARRN
jgi:cytochrome c peroxidase